jgi:DNA polymerase-3 subunit delta
VKLTFASYAKARDFTCLGSWCLLYGVEQHLKRQALALIREEVAAAAGPEAEASWEFLDGANVTARDLVLRAQTIGLFSSARGLVVWQAEKISEQQQEELAAAISGKRAARGRKSAAGGSASGGQQEEAGKPVALSPAVTVVFVTGEPKDRRDRGLRAALQHAIEDKGLAVDCPAMKPAEAARWAADHAKGLGKRLDVAAAQMLASQRVGTSLGELSTEIEKLVAYVGDRPAITVADVDEVTPRLIEEDVFRLLDAVAAQSAGRAVAILRPLLREKREAPERIVPLLAQAIREIWQVKLLLERGWRPGQEPDAETKAMLPADPSANALRRMTGTRAFLLTKRMQHARAFSWARLTRALQAAHACDLAMKGIAGKVTDDETALELLVIQLCSDLPMPVWEDRGVL